MATDTASLVAGWLSFAVTAVGLGGLITQASAINDKLDPFHASRTVEYLGIWFQRQAAFPWWLITKPPPQGPLIKAKMSEGFCGTNDLHIARIPFGFPGKAGWSLILAMLHTESPMSRIAAAASSTSNDGAANLAEKASLESTFTTPSGRGKVKVENAVDWDFLPRGPLTRHQSCACITISRTTLITMLVMTNGRPVFQYSDATGFRAGYASYCGQWYITWPIGQEAYVKFAAHDSIGKTEVLPRSFVQRVDRCGQMASGVVSSSSSDLAVAFCGRKAPGTYRLEHAAKGFQGAHGSRHLFNMMGGKAYEIDFMLARPLLSDDQQVAGSLVLDLPCTEKGGKVRMVVPTHEEAIIKHALDCLPWTSLSWSLHRGLRDILVAYARPVMDAHREELADMLRATVADKADLLRARGWDAQFIRNNMAGMAVSAVLAGSGNSGDSVRVVTDLVAVMTGDWDISRLDEVNFWRRHGEDSEAKLDMQGVVALTKVFVLEWSQEFDYQMYHHLPISLYFG
ncbi:hypothetical protein F5Y19DRAFT_433844 [Xylariaceae sp. FL1651]|nr:hypothetical protein F5Y19DRAFT_433844 [Xylariaceae sp. FL1651]